MTGDKLIVLLLSVLGIAFTYWFFLMKREKQVETEGNAEIIVEGGYSPSTIVIPKGKGTKISFTRKDPTSCLEEVILPDFHIKKYLPLNKTVTIEVKPTESGEYQYHCGMNMYHGKIVVK